MSNEQGNPRPARRRKRCAWAVPLLLLGPLPVRAETVQLKATADIGVSSVVYGGVDERLLSWGRSKRFKLKSIQEMGLIRFDASPVKGRRVVSARLWLHRAGPDRLRYIRLSTVNGDWVEGTQEKEYGPPSGACFNFADYEKRRPWAWPDSRLCDVVMSAGHSLHAWSACRKQEDGWISVEVPPDLVYALAVGDSDGLAVQEGGTLAYFNNFIHSVQSGRFAPYLEVELGGPWKEAPARAARPVVKAEPAASGAAGAGIRHGAIRLTIQPARNVFCWRVKVNGRAVPRWQVAHPAPSGPALFFIEYLTPGEACVVEVCAVARSGASSEPAVVRTSASRALAAAPLLGTLTPPRGKARPLDAKTFRVWPCPPLVKVDPIRSVLMNDDAAAEDGRAPNAVWNGKTIALYGCRGEYVSYQLVIERKGTEALQGIRVEHAALEGAGGARIGGKEIECYRNGYARNAQHRWQPAYAVPLRSGERFTLPDPARGIQNQRNQTVYVDIYIPPTARPGRYAGAVAVHAENGGSAHLPIALEVHDFRLPDTLSFWPQLNCYRLSKKLVQDVYRLAHQHRCVFFLRSFRPALKGRGKDIQVRWTEYDKTVGPLLSGKAFKDSRRGGVPIEALALPFMDSWPTPLTPQTYRYRGDWTRTAAGKDPKRYKALLKVLHEHYLKAPYIGDGLTPAYKEAFAAVQRQFVEHFREKGWTRTEFQCLFVGKNTHRIRYNVNMWWTTDEPYHWDDWLALRFFGRLWTAHRKKDEARRWIFRADISRPQWQGRTLDGAADVIYFGTGAFTSPAMRRRVALLERQGGFDVRVYGSANRDDRSNLESLAWLLDAWLNGANAALPWQAMGNERSLDVNDASVGGNALIAPGHRFGAPPLADLRLKAFRDSEQLIEYLVLFARRYGLSRSQVKAIVARAVRLEGKVTDGAGADNAGALRFRALKAWQLVELKKRLAALILKRRPPVPAGASRLPPTPPGRTAARRRKNTGPAPRIEDAGKRASPP